MNSRYFACQDCKTYADAGYRWAYWTLEHPGIVQANAVVDVSSVLNAVAYWNPPKDDENSWLHERVFPIVRAFFSKHHAHKVTFVESGSFLGIEDFDDWLEIEKR